MAHERHVNGGDETEREARARVLGEWLGEVKSHLDTNNVDAAKVELDIMLRQLKPTKSD